VVVAVAEAVAIVGIAAAVVVGASAPIVIKQ
jgi:hypothetical protein